MLSNCFLAYVPNYTTLLLCLALFKFVLSSLC